MAFPDTSRMQCLPWTTEPGRQRGENQQVEALPLQRCPGLQRHGPRALGGAPEVSSRFWNQAFQAGQPYLLSDLSDRLHTGSIQVVVVLSRLDEVVVLDVPLHLLSGQHKVIVSAVHLVVSLGPGGVCGTVLRVSSHLQQRRCLDQDLRGTQEPNLSGNSEMRSSLTRSFMGPRTMTGRA